MRCALLVLLIPAVAAVSLFSMGQEINSQTMFEEWSQFKDTHKKLYETEEEENLRFYIYQANKRMIDSHNEAFRRGEHSYSLEVNQFADLLGPEFAAHRLGFDARRPRPASSGAEASFLRLPSGIALPASVDWRAQGAVTRVQDQGSCQSCWAFSATGALEGQHFRRSGQLVDLSEQNLVDCAGPFGAAGCDGGTMRAAFSYIREQGGVDTEAAYPYEGDMEPCRFNAAAVGATDVGFVGLPEGDEHALQEAVAVFGPISIAMDASRPTFQFYGSGVYADPTCTTRINHAVLAVGYGTDQLGADYWLVKNSWGEKWGEDGYFRIARNHNTCGVARNGVYPLV